MLSQYQKAALILLRLALGWLMFYSGITKVLDPEWSAAGFLHSAKTFSSLYSWFAQPDILPITNFANQWGLTLLGVSLLLGVGVRFSSLLGAALMALYYFVGLEFPYIGTNSYVVDQHVVYVLALLVLAAFRAGRIWGIDGVLAASRFRRNVSLARFWG